MAATDQPIPDPPRSTQVPNVDLKTVATIAAVVQAQVSQFISPLPDPNILARYNEIVPGSAERILKLTEEQSSHRQKIEREALTAQISESKRGQWIAAVISVLFLVVNTAPPTMGSQVSKPLHSDRREVWLPRCLRY